MMYPPFTLRRDGAVMLCEDASEIDTNYDMPRTDAVVAKIEIVPMMESDPLDKFVDRMSNLYDQIVEPLMAYEFSYENPQQAIEACEKLSSDTTTMFNVMRIKLTKFAGIVCGGLTEELAKEPFNSHAGTLMKNAGLIKQQGIESYSFSWKGCPAFSYPYCISSLIDIVASHPEILNDMIYEPELNALLGGENPLRNFNGFVDMMQCLFKDKARLDRLSEETSAQLRFGDLIQSGAVRNDDYRAKENQKMLVNYLCVLSKTLREVCQTSYEVQMGLVDNTVTPEVYEARMKPLITRVINLFGVGLLLGCYYATSLRRAIAVQKGCEAYVKLLLDTIKEHGGIA